MFSAARNKALTRGQKTGRICCVFLPLPGSKKDDFFSESLQAFAVSVEVTRVFYGKHFVTRHCSSNKRSMYTRNAQNLEWFIRKVCGKLHVCSTFPSAHITATNDPRENTEGVQMASNVSHTVMFSARSFSLTHFSAVFPRIAHVFTILISRSGESLAMHDYHYPARWLSHIYRANTTDQDKLCPCTYH